MLERTLAQIVESYYTLGTETAYVQRRGYRVARWSYRQVAERSRQLARELETRGIGPGDRVLLWGGDCAEWVISFFACILRGAVAVPLDHAASADFAERVCLQTGARLCLCSDRQPQILPCASRLTFESLADLCAARSAAPVPLPGIHGDGAVEIVFTSGTTAEPRGVAVSHRNIFANLEPLEREIRKYSKYERIFHPLRLLNLLPLSHVFGQFLGILIPHLFRGTVVFQNTLNPSEIIRTIRREKVSVLVTVPRLLDSLREKLERDIEASGTLDAFRRAYEAAAHEHFVRRWWRFRRIHRQFGWKFWAVISGGAALSEASEQFWGRLGFAVIQGYGLTETTSMISVNHPFRPGKGSIGKILAGREVRLAPDGEILVRGESIARRYCGANQTLPLSEDEGWFRTGDIGALDEKGNLYFKGRSKNVIIGPEGLNIYPEDLEAALRRQPEIRDCVVVGVEREGNAEACAVILPYPGRDPAPAVKRANESLAGFQRIRRWLVWPDEDFPRTSTQKPILGPIREFAASQTGPLPASGRSGVLSDALSRLTGGKELSRDARLADDLQLTSIDRVALLSALEDRLQVDLDESFFTSAVTVGDLEKMLSGPSRRQPGYPYPGWAQNGAVAVLRNLVDLLLVRPAVLLMARPDIRGRENLRPLHPPVLFVSNHVTQVDVGFIRAALPARFRRRLAVAMLGELLRDMRHPPEGTAFLQGIADRLSYCLVAALFAVFPLPQKSGYRQSFAFAGESAERGYSILVFPEGTRTKDGKMNPFRTGIGLLAANLDVPVVPIRLDGLFQLKKSGKKLARPGTVKVTIGPAVQYSRGTDPSLIAADLFSRVSTLGPGSP